jgi:hypothetical protein
MIEKQCAVDIRELALKAISDLSEILMISRGRCSIDDYERIKKGVGLCIGGIQIDILDVINAVYPELDTLEKG